jgi:nucleotide-binding universal stress UspA family protein
MSKLANENMEQERVSNTEHHLPFRAVLLATDCSPASKTIARIATHFSKTAHAKLYVLHASEPELFGVSTAGPIPELAVMQLDRARQDLHKYAQHIPELRSIKHEELAFLGAPIDAIRSVVESKSIDLLVLGSHARGGLAKLALGSVAEWAIQRLHCPAIIAGPECDPMFHPIRSIVFASDLSAKSDRASSYAMQLAEHYNASLTAIHVSPKHDDETVAAQIETEAMAALHTSSARSDKSNLRYHTVSGDIPTEILRAAEDKRANLLVLGSRRKPPLTNHLPHAKLTAIIRDSNCPVLIVPAEAS